MMTSVAQNASPSLVYMNWHVLTVYTWGIFSSLLLWEFVHDKMYKFGIRKRGLVVKLASLM